MKKLVFAALAATTFATPALAATDTTAISATVPAYCEITAPADNTAVNLTVGQLSALAGGVKVKCNDPQGFTAGVSSANGGKLTEANNPTFYNYSLHVPGYGDVAVTSAVALNSNGFGANAWAINEQTIALSVKMGARSGPNFAGTFSDTLTFEINGN